jgi:transcriptional regulator with XRE-family HTH domain
MKMDIAELIKNRLKQLGYGQKALAEAIHVTPSFISQLLKRKKRPPSPNRTDIYKKIEKFLKLPAEDLARLADLQRTEELKRRFDFPTIPLFAEVRDVVLRKCKPSKQKELHQIFEKEPFGEIERIVTQKLLDVAKGITKEGWTNENWVRMVARANRKSYEEMRVIILEFLDTDIFSLSIENSVYFLEPLIQSWDIDLLTFNMSVVVASKPGENHLKKFAFVETETEQVKKHEPGLTEFLRDRLLCVNITDEELKFLKKLRFSGKRPNSLYYYRELQNLRDPLNFVRMVPSADNITT